MHWTPSNRAGVDVVLNEQLLALLGRPFWIPICSGVR
jgi:hypothetical protein